MPGYESEGAQIMRFLAEEVSKDCFVNIMEQYHPDAYVGKPKRKAGKGQGPQDAGAGQDAEEKRYSEINRAVTRGGSLYSTTSRRSLQASGGSATLPSTVGSIYKKCLTKLLAGHAGVGHLVNGGS